MPNSIDLYIKEAREKHLGDQEIKESLIHAGWSTDEVVKALASEPKDLPVPPPAPRIGMWTGFLYILFFISLCTVATAMGFLYHLWVDKFFPNPDLQSSFNYFIRSEDLIRSYIASLIVAWPIFAYLAYLLNKHLRISPQVRNLRIRKILIYITLVVTFLIFFGNLIKSLYDFLGGSITQNSLGHLVVTLVISGGIFGYYLSVIKDDRTTVS